MNTRSKVWLALSSLLVLSMVLAACATPTPEVIEREKIVTQVVKETQEVVVEKTVEVEKVVEVTPTPEPVDRNGPWIDMAVVVEEPSSEAGITRLAVGELDVYMYTISKPDLKKTVEENPDLAYKESVGSYNEITFNPAGPVFEGTEKLNPFAVPAVREAMNWLVDRSYIAQEIMGGLALPKFFPVTVVFPDYARYAAKARELEAKYAYNVERANEVITAEMEKLGATLVDGKWQYNGEPVTLIFLIRTEDERRNIGDYISNQLETIGFTVDRQYKTSAEASPLWMRGNPADGQWHLYTGGWVTTAIARDQGSNFDFFYTPRGLGSPLWQAYTPSEEFDTISDRMFRNDFKTMEEREELFTKALELSMLDSVRVWLVDRTSFTPFRSEVGVTADLAGSIYGTRLWAHTIRKGDSVGGAVNIAMPSILTEPWNPIGGSNWIYDQGLIRTTGDVAFMPDPYTGLVWPQRAEKADIVVQEGLPVAKTLDWVNLEFAPSIDVPADAWVDWDAANQKFITVGEKFPEGYTSLMKSVVYYPSELYQTKWHDGSNFDIADVVMYMILYFFDRGKPESANFDEAFVPEMESNLAVIKGFKITSEDPLTIEFYSDQYFLDAELNPTTFFPAYDFGPGAWHNLVPGLLADAAKELAFSADKAEANEVEYMSYISGPSIEILKKYLDQATAENYIPYAPTLGQYITAEEATARYANLNEWFRRYGHFWIGTGPMYLERAFPIEGTVILKRFAEYTDKADKWARFGEPKIAAATVDGPGRVTTGQEAAFNVAVTFQGEPYPQSEISEVKFLVFDATGALAGQGVADATGDGAYTVTLPADITSNLAAGANRLEVVVVPSVVSIPTSASFEFVTVAP